MGVSNALEKAVVVYAKKTISWRMECVLRDALTHSLFGNNLSLNV
jgi:hypothetical protein